MAFEINSAFIFQLSLSDLLTLPRKKGINKKVCFLHLILLLRNCVFILHRTRRQSRFHSPGMLLSRNQGLRDPISGTGLRRTLQICFLKAK